MPVSTSPAQSLFAEASRSLEQHAISLKVFKNLALLAEESVSAEDAGRLLLEKFGSEGEVLVFLGRHMATVENVLKRWYATACLQAHETKGMKQ